MFQYQKDMERLDLPAGNVFQLQRSLNRIQVALAGFPAQEAEAYLVLFAAGQGVRAAVVLHLQTSQRLAIYLKEPGPVAPARAPRLLEEGIAFAESMGYLLGDLDFPLLTDGEKATLWDGLPLKAGLPPAAAPARAAAPAKAVSPPSPVAEKEAPPLKKAPSPKQQSIPVPAPPEPRAALAPKPEPIAAAAATAVPEPGPPEVPLPLTLRPPKRPPTAEEIAGKRQRLREALGKLLASL